MPEEMVLEVEVVGDSDDGVGRLSSRDVFLSSPLKRNDDGRDLEIVRRRVYEDVGSDKGKTPILSSGETSKEHHELRKRTSKTQKDDEYEHDSKEEMEKGEKGRKA